MSCGGRIYKGENLEVVIPFSAEGYDNFTISFYTTGDYKITKTADEVEIVDGEVIYTFTKEELDVLPDGVLRYSIDYEKDGTEYVQSSNTSVVVKTPAGYSATSMSDVIASATTEGFDSGVTEGFGIGYESGVTVGYSSGRTDGYSEGFIAGVSDTRGRMATTAITANGVYERGDGFNRVEVDVPLDIPCNIDEGKEINMTNYFPYYQTTVVPESGYAGLSYVSINASGVYNQGVNDVKNQFVTLSATTNGLYLPQSEFAVFKEVCVNVDADCSSAITESYQSGLTVGYNQGIQYQKSLLSAITISENGFFHRADGYSSVNVKVIHGMDSNADFGIGFYGPAEVYIHEDSDWDKYDVETKLGYYITTVINPEEGFSYEFDEMDIRQSWRRTYGEGYHTIWFELDNDIPTNMNWMSIQSGETYGNLNLIIPYTGVEINSFFPNNTYTEINFSNPNTDEEQLLMNLFLY